MRASTMDADVFKANLKPPAFSVTLRGGPLSSAQLKNANDRKKRLSSTFQGFEFFPLLRRQETFFALVRAQYPICFCVLWDAKTKARAESKSGAFLSRSRDTHGCAPNQHTHLKQITHCKPHTPTVLLFWSRLARKLEKLLHKMHTHTHTDLR